MTIYNSNIRIFDINVSFQLGFGRSDTRKNLRKFFEVDKEHIVAYTLSALAKEQLIGTDSAEKALKKYNIDKNKAFPTKL